MEELYSDSWWSALWYSIESCRRIALPSVLPLLDELEEILSTEYSADTTSTAIARIRSGLGDARIGPFGVLQRSLRQINNASFEEFGGNWQSLQRSPKMASAKEAKRRVFLVHGHNEKALELVKSFLEDDMGLEAIVLRDQPNRGMSIIEKLHEYRDVDFAVVLLTADDVGYAKRDSRKHEQRPRQNVVFEYGLFIGLLGRERVAGLIERGVVTGTDANVVHINLDGSWKAELGRELDAAELCSKRKSNQTMQE
jgi:hypothetical protein